MNFFHTPRFDAKRQVIVIKTLGWPNSKRQVTENVKEGVSTERRVVITQRCVPLLNARLRELERGVICYLTFLTITTQRFTRRQPNVQAHGYLLPQVFNNYNPALRYNPAFHPATFQHQPSVQAHATATQCFHKRAGSMCTSRDVVTPSQRQFHLCSILSVPLIINVRQEIWNSS